MEPQVTISCRKEKKSCAYIILAILIALLSLTIGIIKIGRAHV